jgi:hypothetical protein
MDTEIDRNEWVQFVLALDARLYRDDNEFVLGDATVGYFIKGEDGREYLVDHNGEGEVLVPDNLLLGL